MSSELVEILSQWFLDSEACFLVAAALDLEPTLAAELLTRGVNTSELILKRLPEKLSCTEALRVTVKLLDYCPTDGMVALRSLLARLVELS